MHPDARPFPPAPADHSPSEQRRLSPLLRAATRALSERRLIERGRPTDVARRDAAAAALALVRQATRALPQRPLTAEELARIHRLFLALGLTS